MLSEKKVTSGEIAANNVKSVPGSKLAGTVVQNKNVFDKLIELVTGKHNSMIDNLISTAPGDSGADNIGSPALKSGGAATVGGQLTELNVGKVDAVSGKGLSERDFTQAYETKLIGIAENANNYTLPTASTTILGGVKVDGVSIVTANGVISSQSAPSPDLTARAAIAQEVIDRQNADNAEVTARTAADATLAEQISSVSDRVTALEPKIYGIKIDTTNSNPATALTYINDAVGFTPASGNNGAFSYGSWADKFPFNAIKPCLLKNGVVNYYLNPNDYTKKIDGVTASDITTGNDGDVMVEFPTVYWKFETIGTDIFIRYANKKVDSGYRCLAHMRGTTEKDRCYISAYLGNNLSAKLRSLSGKIPTTSTTIGAFRTLAQTNGTGYDQMAYYQLLMLQVLYIVMFKNRDSQTALGRGYVDGNASAIATGGTNKKGMFYGETTGKLQNKFCGIEDFWGNCYYCIDGLFSNATYNMLIANQNFNDTGSGYTDYGQGATADLGGYIGSVQGGTETGFVIKDTNGSATTHYCDYGNLKPSSLPYFGGSRDTAINAGVFCFSANIPASYLSASFSARLLAL